METSFIVCIHNSQFIYKVIINKGKYIHMVLVISLVVVDVSSIRPSWRRRTGFGFGF